MSNALLVLLAFIALSFAKANATVLPLDALRSQGDTNHCWAYSTNHVIASRAQFSDGAAISLDMERDLMYWVYYNRFMARYRKGSPLQDFKDRELLVESGFPAEFWTKFLIHGQPIYWIKEGNESSNISYPDKPKAHLPHVAAKMKKTKSINITKLVTQLSSAKNEAEASELIKEALDKSKYALSTTQTYWYSTPIDVSETAKYVLHNDYSNILNDELLWVFATDEVSLQHTYETYYDGQFRNYYVNFDEIKTMIKNLIDQGFAFNITIKTGGWQNHIMTGIGYDGDRVLIADSIAPHYYWTEFSNVDSITAFRSTIGSQIPRSSRMSVRPTKNPRVRPLK